MENLEELRKAIRKIDRDLAGLFEKRMALSREVGEYKVKSGTPIYDSDREEENIRALTELLQCVADRPYFIEWYQMLMKMSRSVQKTDKESGK